MLWRAIQFYAGTTICCSMFNYLEIPVWSSLSLQFLQSINVVWFASCSEARYKALWDFCEGICGARGTLQWPHKSLFLHYNLPVTFVKYLLTCFPVVWVRWVPLSSPLRIVRDLYMFFVIVCPASFSFLTKTVTFFAELSPPSSAYRPWIKVKQKIIKELSVTVGHSCFLWKRQDVQMSWRYLGFCILSGTVESYPWHLSTAIEVWEWEANNSGM
jgi:hypothetical protein